MQFYDYIILSMFYFIFFGTDIFLLLPLDPASSIVDQNNQVKQSFRPTGALTAHSTGSQRVLEIEQVHILPFPLRHVQIAWQTHGAALNCHLAEGSLIADHNFPFSMCQREWESLGIAHFLQTTKRNWLSQCRKGRLVRLVQNNVAHKSGCV